MKKFWTLACLALLAAACGAYADPPKTLDKLPVFPGAALDAARSQTQEQRDTEVKNSHDQYLASGRQHQPFANDFVELLDTQSTTYTVTAWPEDVLLWYVKQLSATPANLEQFNHPTAGVGAFSPVMYNAFEPLTPDQEKDLYVTGPRNDPETGQKGNWDGAWVKSVLQGRPRTPDGWIWEAGLQWIYRQSNAVTTRLTVQVSNEGTLDGIGKKLVKKVIVELEARTERRHPGWEFSRGNLDDASLAKLLAMFDTPPTEKDLGAPVYAGAEMDFDTLIHSPGNIGYLFPYRTTDSLEKVIAFYEKATGLKAQDAGHGAVGIVLKGTSLQTAESEVYVQDISGMGQPSVLLMFMKNMNSRKLSDADAARLEALRKTPPTENELGAPLYPGAQFDFEQLRALMMSGNTSDMDAVMYPYSVAAPFDKVVQFYKDKTGNAPIADEGVAGFFLKPAAGQSSNVVRSVQVQRVTATSTTIMFARITPRMSGSGSATPQQPAQSAASTQQTQPQATPPATAPQVPAGPKAKALFDTAKSGSPDEILAAIKDGAKVDERDASGFTALMYAAMSNPNPAVITTLVAAGASVDVLTPAKMTPLMLAAKSTKKPAVVQALLEAGANMKLKDSSGKTAFDYATGNAALMFTAQLVALGVGRL